MAEEGFFHVAAVFVEELLDDEVVGAAAVIEERNKVLRRSEVLQRRNQPTRVEDYIEAIVPRYSNQEFKSHFCMQKSSVEELCQLLAPHLTDRTVSVKKKVLSSLWLLGNIESFRGVGDRFGLSKGTLHSVLFEVCDALEAIWGRLIVWPTTHQQFKEVANGFRRKTGFPGVVGAIDGTHIPIPGPLVNREAYINKKGFPSMQLQAVCDSELRFLDVVCGWAGSVHDARVFRNCALRNWLEDGNFPDDFHLLGDSAYALTQYMIVPYRDNGHLTPEERSFNQRHSSTQVVIERAFGLFKCKFRRMKYLDMEDIEKIPLVICAACALHNFILIKENLENDDNYHEVTAESVDEEGEVVFDETHLDLPRADVAAGQAKRDELRDLLA